MTSAKKDYTQTAFDVFQQAIGEADKPQPKTARQLNSAKGGRVGGAKRAKNLDSDTRAAIAKKAADARWSDVATPPAKFVPE